MLAAVPEAVTRPVLVQKFGGSSLGTPGRIKRAAKRVAASQRAGYDVVVVVSAMGDSTDRLLTLASRVAKDPAARELDLLLSTGEGARRARSSPTCGASPPPIRDSCRMRGCCRTSPIRRCSSWPARAPA